MQIEVLVILLFVAPFFLLPIIARIGPIYRIISAVIAFAFAWLNYLIMVGPVPSWVINNGVMTAPYEYVSMLCVVFLRGICILIMPIIPIAYFVLAVNIAFPKTHSSHGRRR